MVKTVITVTLNNSHQVRGSKPNQVDSHVSQVHGEPGREEIRLRRDEAVVVVEEAEEALAPLLGHLVAFGRLDLQKFPADQKMKSVKTQPALAFVSLYDSQIKPGMAPSSGSVWPCNGQDYRERAILLSMQSTWPYALGLAKQMEQFWMKRLVK